MPSCLKLSLSLKIILSNHYLQLLSNDDDDDGDDDDGDDDDGDDGGC
jgi:hypothetical protein